MSGIAHRQHDVASWLRGLVPAGVGLVELLVRGFQSQLSAARHGMPSIEGQVHDDLLDLAEVRLAEPQVVQGYGQDLDVFSDQPPEQGVEIQHDVVQVNDARRKHLLAAEREQLAGNARGSIGGRLDLRRAVGQAAAGGNAFGHDLGVSQGDGEQVVEIVSDAASQTSNGFHLLRLAESFLEGHALGNILRQRRRAQHSSRIVDQRSVCTTRTK